MAEVLELEHLFRVRARDRHQTLVRYERAEPALRPLLVRKIEGCRSATGSAASSIPSGRSRCSVWLSPILVTRSPDPPELRGEPLDLWWERHDLCVDDAAGAARVDRSMHLAAERDRFDGEDAHATMKSERIGRRKRPEYSVCDGQGAAADKGDQQPGREVTRRREERLHDDDDHDEGHGGAERFG